MLESNISLNMSAVSMALMFGGITVQKSIVSNGKYNGIDNNPDKHGMCKRWGYASGCIY